MVLFLKCEWLLYLFHYKLRNYIAVSLRLLSVIFIDSIMNLHLLKYNACLLAYQTIIIYRQFAPTDKKRLSLKSLHLIFGIRRWNRGFLHPLLPSTWYSTSRKSALKKKRKEKVSICVML